MYSGKTIVVTGGAGFAGSHLALAFKSNWPSARVIALDNLKRRGSELNITRLTSSGVEFLHGDVRNREDFITLPQLDLLVECSAEPSVLAGYDSAPDYVINSNLMGALRCLEWARRYEAPFLFLSTSRVYPVQLLNRLKLVEEETRFDLAPDQPFPGVSYEGIAEAFPLEGTRSLYGSTKLSAELFIAEYQEIYGLPAVINRCGVIAGPGQLGRVDQGILAFWIAAHVYERPLSYIGFGGQGKQLRDMLHIQDLTELVLKQVSQIDKWDGRPLNAGGGREGSVSLCELTGLCQEFTGKKIPINSVMENRPADIPLYMTDNSAMSRLYDWEPRRPVQQLVEETVRWVVDNKERLRPIFCS
ncbi:MAG: NAD-dependent epimerase/dehydratase family protein [Candidatus Hydrogenedens sp.]|jgi:CDP-paratose 2-epimerase|nr:NAD-dependent epimerase/dehydratase family protein [Candidatus Hydrogenedens sp.]